MTVGFSTDEQWLSEEVLKQSGNENLLELFSNENSQHQEEMEAIWVVLDHRNAPRYLTLTVGPITEEYLFRIDLTGATPVLEDEDGRVLYIRKKGGENHVERTNQRTAGQNTKAL